MGLLLQILHSTKPIEHWCWYEVRAYVMAHDKVPWAEYPKSLMQRLELRVN